MATREVLLAVLTGLILAPAASWADQVVAVRTIPSQTVLSDADIEVRPGVEPGGASRAEQAIGRETRVALYQGQPIHLNDLTAPTLVERNQIVTLLFQTGGLVIAAEGRALGRAAQSESVRVINLASRTTVTGQVGADGRVYVGGTQPSAQK